MAISTDRKNKLNRIIPIPGLNLGDVIYNLQTGVVDANSIGEEDMERADSGKVLIGQGSSADVGWKSLSGDITNDADGVTAIGSNKVLAGMTKVATRDLEVAIGAASATATNAADISGVVLGAHFTDASPDATATEITGVRFVPTTGALTVTVNANATAATTVRVTILQAA